MPQHFFGYHFMSLAPHPGFSDLRRSPPALSSTPTLGFFFNAQASTFLIHSHVTYEMPCHARGHSHSYLGKQRISLGVTIILSMCLCPHTQLDCNQFTIILGFVFIHVNTLNILLVVKTLIKKYRAAATLISKQS